MIFCIIQARTGSTRLPGKVLKNICDKPLLIHVVERVAYSKLIDDIIVATTISKSDDAIESLCLQNGIMCFRGSEEDVLDRYYRAAQAFQTTKGDAIVRITADCPLIDPDVIDQVIELYKQSGADYASNIDPPTYPDGLDVEVFSFAALEKAWLEAKLLSEREHVTLFIREHRDRFKISNLENASDVSALRWTVDEAEDLEIIKEIYESLYKAGSLFKTDDVLDYLAKHSEVIQKNSSFSRNEGLLKSLQHDRLIDQ